MDVWFQFVMDETSEAISLIESPESNNQAMTDSASEDEQTVSSTTSTTTIATSVSTHTRVPPAVAIARQVLLNLIASVRNNRR